MQEPPVVVSDEVEVVVDVDSGADSDGEGVSDVPASEVALGTMTVVVATSTVGELSCASVVVGSGLESVGSEGEAEATGLTGSAAMVDAKLEAVGTEAAALETAEVALGSDEDGPDESGADELETVPPFVERLTFWSNAQFARVVAGPGFPFVNAPPKWIDFPGLG